MTPFAPARQLAITLACGSFLVTGAAVGGTEPPARGDDAAIAQASLLGDDVFIYRGELAFQGEPLNGAIDLEFRLYETEIDTLSLAPPVMAERWPIVEGVVVVGLDFGSEMDRSTGAWLEVEVDGVILSPRQYVPPRGWTMSGAVNRAGTRRAMVVENEDPPANHRADEALSEHAAVDPSINDQESNDTEGRPFSASRAANTPRAGTVSGMAIRSTNTLRDGGDRDGSFTGGSGVDFLFNFGDRFFNSTDSVYVNIDTNNDDSTRVFEIAKDRSADVGGTPLFNVIEFGRVGIGVDYPSKLLHARGNQATIRLEDDDNSTSYSEFIDAQPTQLRINKQNLSGSVFLDLNPKPLDRSSNGLVRFFRDTNSTGVKGLRLYRGNDTSELSAAIGVDGAHSYFQLHGGNVGIGESTPSARLDVYKNESNGAAGIASINAGTGYAGYFSQTNGSTNTAAVYATSEGSGPALLANHDTSGIGVHGIGNPGVYGYSTTGRGVYGRTDDWFSDGVFGTCGDAGGQAAGIYGSSGSGGGWAALFDGSISISENLYVNGSKSFLIDNPLNPSQEYLFHSCIESDEMKNVYDGVVTLDERGEAEVSLPEWFDLVNANFRYQLTCVGGHAPVYIAQRIENNRFSIAGGHEGLEISWQVTGARIDPAALAADFRVIRPKHEADRGTYLFPEGYGQPPSLKATRIVNPSDRQRPAVEEAIGSGEDVK